MQHQKQKILTAIFVTAGLIILQYATQSQLSASPSYEKSLLMTKRPSLIW